MDPPNRSALETPGKEEKDTSTEKRTELDAIVPYSLRVSLTAVFAALYALAVVFIPFGYSIFQIRIADALLPLSIVFGWPAILGFALGAAVANFFGPFGAVDIVGGAVANFVACYVAWAIAKPRTYSRRIAAVIAEVLVITLFVGTYLGIIAPTPFFDLDPIIVGWIGVLGGSIVAIGLIGYVLLEGLLRTGIVQWFHRQTH